MERMLNFQDDLGEGKFFIDFHSQDSQPKDSSTEDTQNKVEKDDNSAFEHLIGCQTIEGDFKDIIEFEAIDSEVVPSMTLFNRAPVWSFNQPDHKFFFDEIASDEINNFVKQGEQQTEIEFMDKSYLIDNTEDPNKLKCGNGFVLKASCGMTSTFRVYQLLITSGPKAEAVEILDIEKLIAKLDKHTGSQDNYQSIDMQDFYYPHFWDLYGGETAVKLEKDANECVQVEEDRISQSGTPEKGIKTKRIQNYSLYTQYWALLMHLKENELYEHSAEEVTYYYLYEDKENDSLLDFICSCTSQLEFLQILRNYSVYSRGQVETETEIPFLYESGSKKANKLVESNRCLRVMRLWYKETLLIGAYPQYYFKLR